MGAVFTLLLYIILGAVALILTYLLLRAIIKAVSHFLVLLPEYLWHNLLVLLFVGIVVVGIIVLVGLV